MKIYKKPFINAGLCRISNIIEGDITVTENNKILVILLRVKSYHT
jgi:hypothetical protein